MNKGKLFIVSGPSGSGKDTLLKEFFKKHPEVAFSISSISRPMRPGEIEGEKYNFISREEFLELIKNDMLLEYNEFCGNFYGSPKAPIIDCIENGKDIILEVDVNGAAKVREKMPNALSVFIMPPSYDILLKRLSGRGTDDESVIKKRMTEALNEIKRADEYDYIVINDDLNKAVDDLINIIISGCPAEQNKKIIIDEVLKNA